VGHLKIFSRITEPILSILGTNHGYTFLPTKGITLLQGEIIATE
jgi:hypothetical protein